MTYIPKNASEKLIMKYIDKDWNWNCLSFENNLSTDFLENVIIAYFPVLILIKNGVCGDIDGPILYLANR